MSSNNNYIIIGGTSGIGLATADYLRDIGNNVIVGSRHDRKEITHNFIPVDVTSIKSVNTFFKEISSICIFFIKFISRVNDIKLQMRL